MILNISEAANLAFHATAYLAARDEELASAREMADRMGVSEAHLSKVLQRLVRSGIVGSTRGPRGGFRLTRQPDKISLMEIYIAIDGPFTGVSCLVGKSACQFGACVFGSLLGDVQNLVEDHFNSTTLADIRA